MQRYDSQECMEAGSPRGVSLGDSRSTSHVSVVRQFLGVTDAFDGLSNTIYKNWLQLVQPTAATHVYASFIDKKLADQCDGVWTTGTVQCLHQGILPSMTRLLPGQQHLAQQKVSVFRLFGQMTLTPSATFLVC